MKQRFLSVCAALFALMALHCAAARAADNVYAILYDDGALVFQYGNTPESGRSVTKTYEVDLDAVYTWDSDTMSANTPWYKERYSIRVVSFADKISPSVTSFWFRDCVRLERLDNVGNLDTAKVTDMSAMFSCCTALTELDLSRFNTSNVTSMMGMFNVCENLKTLDLSHFDTANVTNTRCMFAGCHHLTAADVSRFDTSNAVDISCMFDGCRELEELDISTFNTAKVQDMQSIFYGCHNLKTIYASDKFTVADRAIHAGMFSGCASLVGGNGTGYDSERVDGTYARIDGGTSAPGYFTAYKTEPTPEPETYVITSYAGEGGAITPDGDTRVRAGSSQKYVITPNPGWRVLSVRMDGAEIGALSEYVFQNIAANHNLVALFERLPYYAITAAVANNGALSVTLENTDAVTVAVWYSDRNGKFLSADMQTVPANAGNVTFELPFAYKARVALFDSAYRPLCDPVTVR